MDVRLRNTLVDSSGDLPFLSLDRMFSMKSARMTPPIATRAQTTGENHP